MPSATSWGFSIEGDAVRWLTGSSSESSITFSETARPRITRRIVMGITLLHSRVSRFGGGGVLGDKKFRSRNSFFSAD